LKNPWIGPLFILLFILLTLVLSGCTDQTAIQEKKEQSLELENSPPSIQECRVEYFDRWNSATVYFVGYAVDEEGYVSYHWTLSDGFTTTEQSFVHTFESAGTYYANLTVYDNVGAINSTQVIVSIPEMNSDRLPTNESLIVGIWSNNHGDTIEFTGDRYFIVFGNWTSNRYWFENGRLTIYSILNQVTTNYFYYFEGKDLLVFYPSNTSLGPEYRWTRNN